MKRWFIGVGILFMLAILSTVSLFVYLQWLHAQTAPVQEHLPE